MIRMLLKRDGHETLSAEDGLKALECVNHSAFDLIITDLRMPNMDGMHLLRAVKALEPCMPVIVITAYASSETAAETLKLGAFACVDKPFNITDLMEAVRRALEAGTGKPGVPGLPSGSG